MSWQWVIGIDVSKDKLDWVILQDGMVKERSVVENTPGGVELLVNQVDNIVGHPGRPVLYCLEHTGLYVKPFLAVAAVRGLAVWLEMAYRIKHSTGLYRGKSDQKDAHKIALYAHRHQDNVQLWKASSEVLDKLRNLFTMRENIVRQQKALQTPLQQMKGFAPESDIAQLRLCCQPALEGLAQSLKIIENQMLELIKSNPEIKTVYKLLNSVVGVGPIIATGMIVYTENFTRLNDPKKLNCYCGNAPFPNESGKYIGRKRVSVHANKTLKTLLTMGARSAITYDPEIKAYAARKMEEKKPYLQVVNNVRRKLVDRMCAVVKRGTMYEKNFNTHLAKS
jgi:transposase